MSTIVIKPKNKAEETLLTKLLRKMNVDAHIVHEPFPNYETIAAIQDVESGKGTRTKDSQDVPILLKSISYGENLIGLSDSTLSLLPSFPLPGIGVF